MSLRPNALSFLPYLFGAAFVLVAFLSKLCLLLDFALKCHSELISKHYDELTIPRGTNHKGIRFNLMLHK